MRKRPPCPRRSKSTTTRPPNDPNAVSSKRCGRMSGHLARLPAEHVEGLGQQGVFFWSGSRATHMRHEIAGHRKVVATGEARAVAARDGERSFGGVLEHQDVREAA